MKNYIIAFLITVIIVLGTYFYKLANAPVLNDFPIGELKVDKTSDEPPLYLFIFFSRNNCHVCLEAIQILNKLPSPFVVTGIVPGEELASEEDLRTSSGATFKLIAFNKTHGKFSPNYSPTLFGVSGQGRILFVLPGVPDEKSYLHNFLSSFYGKSIEMLISESAKSSP